MNERCWVITKDAAMPILKGDRTRSVAGFANPKCYARGLKGCSTQMSGEHPVSRALLERVDQELGERSREVEIRNLAFQPPGVAQRFGIANLESKILCSPQAACSPTRIVASFDGFGFITRWLRH